MNTKELIGEAMGIDFDVNHVLWNTNFIMHKQDAENLIKIVVMKCADFTDPVTRNLMLNHFGVK